MSTAHIPRRSAFWSRLSRENRPQTPVTTGHRRKSRSPDADGRIPSEQSAIAESSNARKRKKQGAYVPHTAAASHAAAGPHTAHARTPRASHDIDMTSDRGRKQKRRPQSTVNEDVEMRALQEVPQSQRRQGKSRRKGRSQSRDATQSQKAASPEPSDDGESEKRQYSGPLAIADYTRMKEELEKLKQHMDVAKKTIKQQSKVIDGLRRDLTSAEKSHNEQHKQVEKLRIQVSKSEEAMSSFEANLNCQICMEILMKPYGLSPCGHVLCLTCLQEWFKAAPPGEDEMYDDTPDELVYRKKSCPVCRAVIFSRPIPLFLVKSLANAFDRVKQPVIGPPRISPPPDPDTDPWAGIFVPDDMTDTEDDETAGEDGWSVDEDDDEDDDRDDDGYPGYGDDDDPWGFDGYGTGEDEAPYEGEYIPARWAPPTVYVSPDDYAFEDVTEEQLSMLRRGATLQMIALFSMSYTHDEGLKAVVDGNELYLGWNIVLHDVDHTGEEFMDWAVADVFERPERWDKEDTEDGFVAWRLVREDEDEDYETTDSEAWAADLTIDDDEF